MFLLTIFIISSIIDLVKNFICLNLRELALMPEARFKEKLMILITGAGGEGSGLVANLAIERILADILNACVIILDDTGEFFPLKEKVNGVRLFVGDARKPLNEQIALSKPTRFFQIVFDVPMEQSLHKVKKLELELSAQGKWVFVIFKSLDTGYAHFIQSSYEKL